MRGFGWSLVRTNAVILLRIAIVCHHRRRRPVRTPNKVVYRNACVSLDAQFLKKKNCAGRIFSEAFAIKVDNYVSIIKLADDRLRLLHADMDVAGPSRMPPKEKKSNWSEDDKFQLVYEIEKRKRIIKNKFNNTITKAAKRKAWQEIASVMNSRHPSTLRTVPQIKKQWQNLKSRSRAELTLSKKADSTTGEFTIRFYCT